MQFPIYDFRNQVVGQLDEILVGRRVVEWRQSRHGPHSTSSCMACAAASGIPGAAEFRRDLDGRPAPAGERRVAVEATSARPLAPSLAETATRQQVMTASFGTA
jgi:hypothetical protein